MASSAGATAVFNNAAVWNYQGSSALNGTDTITNTGSFNVVAAGALNGLETFNNQSAGRVVLTAADLNYAGPAGTQIRLDVNLSQTARSGDVVVIAGQNIGPVVPARLLLG